MTSFEAWLRCGPTARKDWATYNALHPYQRHPRVAETTTPAAPRAVAPIQQAPTTTYNEHAQPALKPHVRKGLRSQKIGKIPKPAKTGIAKVVTRAISHAKLKRAVAPKVAKIHKVVKPKVHHARVKKPRIHHARRKKPKIHKMRVRKPRIRKKKSMP